MAIYDRPVNYIGSALCGLVSRITKDKPTEDIFTLARLDDAIYHATIKIKKDGNTVIDKAVFTYKPTANAKLNTHSLDTAIEQLNKWGYKKANGPSEMYRFSNDIYTLIIQENKVTLGKRRELKERERADIFTRNQFALEVKKLFDYLIGEEDSPNTQEFVKPMVVDPDAKELQLVPLKKKPKTPDAYRNMLSIIEKR